MKAQDKLNKIDEILCKNGFKMAGTVEKIEVLIKEHKSYKRKSEDFYNRIEQAIHLLYHGEL